MGPIDPIRPVRLIRRETAPKAERDEAPAVSVTISVAPEPAPPLRTPTPPAPSAEAHLAAQNARARGLRGGQTVLDSAHAAYLGAEWSGASDRRRRRGHIAKTEI